jgi:hypothetical protein
MPGYYRIVPPGQSPRDPYGTASRNRPFPGTSYLATIVLFPQGQEPDEFNSKNRSSEESN